jgi:hypothetical protein
MCPPTCPETNCTWFDTTENRPLPLVTPVIVSGSP